MHVSTDRILTYQPKIFRFNKHFPFHFQTFQTYTTENINLKDFLAKNIPFKT